MKTALLLLIAMFVSSSASASGINLFWDDCSVNGRLYKLFACDRNDGSNTLVASFRAPPGIEQFSAAEVTILLFYDSPLPDWWRLRTQNNQPNQCRHGALSTNADFTAGPHSCSDPFNGQAMGGIGTYEVETLPHTQNTRLLLANWLPSGQEHPLVENEEYYAAKIVIDHRKTVGPEACGGCNQPIIAMIINVNVVQPKGAPGGNIDISSPDVRNQAAWQGDCYYGCVDFPASCHIYCSTPAARTSWGAIKSLYR